MSALVAILTVASAWLTSAWASDPISTAMDVAGELCDADPTALRRAAVAGIAQAMDEETGVPGHAVYTRAEWAQREAWRRGHREGVALEYGLVTGRGLVVTDVYPDGPAARAGLRRGDLVVGVDRRALTGLDDEAIQQVIFGALGSQVVLDVRRGPELHTIRVDRGPWHSGLVRAFPYEDGVVVRIPFFGEGTSQRLAETLAAVPPDAGLVIDLRSNGGGLLDEAVAAADLFLPPGEVIVHIDSLDGTVEARLAQGPQTWAGRAVIIVNQDTAAEAEAFAAALHTRDDTPIVGTWTAGRSDLPEGRDIGDDLVLQVPAHRMRDPLGRSWAGQGLRPDVLSTPVEIVMPAAPGSLPPDLPREAALQLIRQR